MHIIGMIIGVVALVVFWWARLKMLGDVADKVTDVVETAINAPRRWAFVRKTKGNPISHIDDPRIGAICLLFILVSSDGLLEAKEQDLIKNQARLKFNCNEKEWEDLSTYSKWVAGRVVGGEVDAKKIVRTVFGLAPNAGHELFEMVSAIEENMCEPQLHAIVLGYIKQTFSI